MCAHPAVQSAIRLRRGFWQQINIEDTKHINNCKIVIGSIYSRVKAGETLEMRKRI